MLNIASMNHSSIKEPAKGQLIYMRQRFYNYYILVFQLSGNIVETYVHISLKYFFIESSVDCF